jgi:hypothetical protein
MVSWTAGGCRAAHSVSELGCGIVGAHGLSVCRTGPAEYSPHDAKVKHTALEAPCGTEPDTSKTCTMPGGRKHNWVTTYTSARYDRAPQEAQARQQQARARKVPTPPGTHEERAQRAARELQVRTPPTVKCQHMSAAMLTQHRTDAYARISPLCSHTAQSLPCLWPWFVHHQDTSPRSPTQPASLCCLCARYTSHEIWSSQTRLDAAEAVRAAAAAARQRRAAAAARRAAEVRAAVEARAAEEARQKEAALKARLSRAAATRWASLAAKVSSQPEVIEQCPTCIAGIRTAHQGASSHGELFGIAVMPITCR